MHKLFLSVASMIVTHFLQKAYRKITEKPTIGNEEKYRAVRDASEQWLREHQPNRPVAAMAPRAPAESPGRRSRCTPDARPMRDNLSSIAQANLNLMESLAR